jgi:sugar O-acyltransferase (sialic acid O-acetyltransferase NeuD family)
VASIRLVVFGGRGAGLLLVDTVRRLPAPPAIEVLGYLNDREPIGTLIGGLPVLGPFEQWPALPSDVMFAAPLHSHKDMPRRIARIVGLGIPDERWVSVADPLSVKLSGVTHGVGCFFATFSTIKSDVILGRHVAVRDFAMIGHDTLVGDFVFIGTGVAVLGYCRIGRGAYIAPGAVIRERTTIGEEAIVGIGAIVTRDVADGMTVIGNPARVRLGEGR